MRVVVSLILPVLLCGVVSAQQKDEFENGVVLSSEHWRVLTDLPADSARKYLKLLDALFDEYREVFSGMRIEEWGRVDVYIYKSRRQMEERYKIGKRVLGLYLRSLRRIVAHHGFYGSAGTTANVLAHEAVHAFQHAYFGNTNAVPVWVLEGMAVMTEGMTMKGGAVRLTKVPRDRLLRVRSEIEKKTTLPLREVFRTGRGSFDRRHYAYSGLFIYFLLKGRLRGAKDAFFEYLKELKEKGADAESFEKILSSRTGKSLEEVEKAFHRWVMRQKFEYSGKAVGKKYKSKLMSFSVDAPTKKWRININTMLAKEEYVVYWRRNPYARFSVSATANLYDYGASELLELRKRELEKAGIQVERVWKGTVSGKDAAFIEFETEDRSILKDGKRYRIREIWLSTEKAVYKLRFQAEPDEFGELEEEFQSGEEKFRLLK